MKTKTPKKKKEKASITIRDFEVLLSAVYARPVRAPGDLRGGKIHLSIRTIR